MRVAKVHHDRRRVCETHGFLSISTSWTSKSRTDRRTPRGQGVLANQIAPRYREVLSRRDTFARVDESNDSMLSTTASDLSEELGRDMPDETSKGQRRGWFRH